MNILRTLKKIFSVKNRYIGYSKYKILIVFGVEILKFAVRNTSGNNNKIYIVNDFRKKEIKKIPGLIATINGNNNQIVVYEPFNFLNCKIYIRGDNNFIKIDKNADFNNVNMDIRGDSEITIGKNVNSTGIVSLECVSKKSKIKIGDGCMLARNIRIMSGDHHRVTSSINGEVINKGRFCEIGNHVWIAEGATICKNVHIANNSIIGTKAVVTKSFEEENVVIAGNPAKIVKRDVEWHRDND